MGFPGPLSAGFVHLYAPNGRGSGVSLVAKLNSESRVRIQVGKDRFRIHINNH
jgi:hypothetical protein